MRLGREGRHGRHWPRPDDDQPDEDQPADDHHADEPPSTPIGEHTHEQSRVVSFGLVAMVLLLLLCNGLTLMYGIAVDSRIERLEEFVAGRGEERAAENDRLNQRINDAVCDVLDQLPEGALFGPLRIEYGCGPGVPLELLDPAVSKNLADIIGGTQPAPQATDPEDLTSEPDEMPPGAPEGAKVTPGPTGSPP